MTVMIDLYDESSQIKQKSKFQYKHTSSRLREPCAPIWQVPNTVHLSTKVIDTKTTHDQPKISYYLLWSGSRQM
jgi:hypothetical protein